MKKKFTKIAFLLGAAGIPVFAGAFSLSGSTFASVITEIINIIGLTLPILFALCFLVFFWGVSKFILNSGSAAEIQKGRSYMIWGIVALFILVSFRVIVGIIAKDLEIGDSSFTPLIPTSSNPSGQEYTTYNLPQGVPAP